MNYSCANGKELTAAVAAAAEGDCIQVESFSAVAEDTGKLLSALKRISEKGADFVSLREGVDTRDVHGQFFIRVCLALCELDHRSQLAKRRAGVERAKEEGKYKGRKPIEVDGDLFEDVIARWENDEITARQAMSELKLKPNTFYRRIKEREEQKLKDYKKVEHEIRSEIKEAAKQSRRDLDDLKQQVRAEAKELKKSANEVLELRDVEKEIRRGRARAEAEHNDAVKQMKKEVEVEAKELKKLMQEK